jgi:DNA-3-methyladenine glycosylase
VVIDKQGKGNRLSRVFFLRENVELIAKELLGKFLFSRVSGHVAGGMIVETEAYRGPDDKASHAFNNKRTSRTEPMFAMGGTSYIYLCYGIHHLFNVVTAPEGIPHAILIRAIEPTANIPIMLKRRGIFKLQRRLTAGPGTLTQALGLTTGFSGFDMMETESPVWIMDHGIVIPEEEIIASPRVGVDYAEECKDWPWRFRILNSKWTSPA